MKKGIMFITNESIVHLGERVEINQHDIFVALTNIEDNKYWVDPNSYIGFKFSKNRVKELCNSSFPFIVQEFFHKSIISYENRKKLVAKITDAGYNPKDLITKFGYENIIAWREMEINEIQAMKPKIEAHIARSRTHTPPKVTEMRLGMFDGKYKTAATRVHNYFESELKKLRSENKRLKGENKRLRIRIKELEKFLGLKKEKVS